MIWKFSFQSIDNRRLYLYIQVIFVNANNDKIKKNQKNLIQLMTIGDFG